MFGIGERSAELAMLYGGREFKGGQEVKGVDHARTYWGPATLRKNLIPRGIPTHSGSRLGVQSNPHKISQHLQSVSPDWENPNLMTHRNPGLNLIQIHIRRSSIQASVGQLVA